jgi:hypothetical protein
VLVHLTDVCRRARHLKRTRVDGLAVVRHGAADGETVGGVLAAQEAGQGLQQRALLCCQQGGRGKGGVSVQPPSQQASTTHAGCRGAGLQLRAPCRSLAGRAAASCAQA